MTDQNGVERCEFIHAHEDIVEKVTRDMPDDEILYDLAELFKIFGDSTRIKILYVLFESEMCVCDIAQLLNMTQSAISHQLRALKQSKLVKYRREGKTVFYSLADGHVRTIIDQGMEHVDRITTFKEDFSMKKRFQLTDLDCANCARKMEDAIKKIDGVNDANVSFLTQKMMVDADDARFDAIMQEVVKVCKRVEPDCVINL